MPYPEIMIHGMRQELAQLGIEETKTPEAVKEAVENTEGTVMVVVNSVCGCAAGGVRPGIAMALQNSEVKPDKAITVFAGAAFGSLIFVPLSLKKKRLVPFGVFLAVGAVVAFVFGDAIVTWYGHFLKGD